MLFEKLQEVADELPGCRLTSIVSLETGLSLACVSAGDREDAAGADAFHSDVYRHVARAMKELDASQDVENLVIKGAASTFVSSPLGDSGYFWHVATDSSTTLGFTQAVMRKHRADVQNSVSGFLGS